MGVAAFPQYVTYIREEGRLAALAGDREGAIRAYRHYLALRSEAEPALQPEVRRVREELEAVERESADRRGGRHARPAGWRALPTSRGPLETSRSGASADSAGPSRSTPGP